MVGDRLSGWAEVFSSVAGTTVAGASLVRHLRSFFATFGVPEELFSDGGPEFRAGSTEDLLKLWNVEYWVSSALSSVIWQTRGSSEKGQAPTSVKHWPNRLP